MPRRQIPMCQIWMDFFTFLGGYPEDESSDEGLQASESHGDFTEPNITEPNFCRNDVFHNFWHIISRNYFLGPS